MFDAEFVVTCERLNATRFAWKAGAATTTTTGENEMGEHDDA
jgi:hypothetical protein